MFKNSFVFPFLQSIFLSLGGPVGRGDVPGCVEPMLSTAETSGRSVFGLSTHFFRVACLFTSLYLLRYIRFMSFIVVPCRPDRFMSLYSLHVVIFASCLRYVRRDDVNPVSDAEAFSVSRSCQVPAGVLGQPQPAEALPPGHVEEPWRHLLSTWDQVRGLGTSV